MSSSYHGSTFSLDVDDPPVLTVEVVQSLMNKIGFHEWAADQDLIQRMVDVAKSPSGRLDEQAFVSALTSDLKDWNVGHEQRESTYIFDVFGVDNLSSFVREEKKHEEGSVSANNQEHSSSHDEKADIEDGNDANSQKSASTGEEGGDIPVLSRWRTYKVIDFVTDSYGSFIAVILIWAVYICNATAYSSLIFSTDPFQFSCQDFDAANDSQGDKFACTLVETIVTWFSTAALLVIFGFVVFVPLSIGNHPSERGLLRQSIATFLTAFETM